MEFKSIEIIFEDMFKDLHDKLENYAHDDEANFLEVYKITNYLFYLENNLTKLVNEYAPGYFETAITSRLRANLHIFVSTWPDYFRKRLEKTLDVPSDPSNIDLNTFLPLIYDALEKVKVILKYIDNSFLPTSHEEKILPLNRAFFTPSLDLLMLPLNKATQALIKLPRERAREGYVHVILILSTIEKLYKDLKLATKKMEELVKSQENIRNHLKETVLTLCLLNLRELVSEYEIRKDQMKTVIEDDKLEIELDDKGFIYKEDVGKLVRICVGVCKNDIKLPRTEAEAWLDQEYRKKIERRLKEIIIILYEKALKKLLEYAEEPIVSENLITKLERIFDVEEGKIKLYNVETARKYFVGEKGPEEDIEANL